ncbi:MAG: mechanosensitive ion channel family protein [Oscillospiraceae bacterium]|nr:mechanosensitive ion channel family protein [Oscillospiraceae bacterium]
MYCYSLAVGADAGTAAEELSNIHQTLQDLPLRTLLIAVAMLAGSIAAVQLVILLTDRVLKRTKLDLSVHRFIKAIVRVVLYFAALLMIASYLGIDVTSLVALLSVVSLAVTLSVQNALSNVAGGVMVMGTKPFKQGDYVSVDGLEGTVEEIGVVYTKLHTIDNRAVLIPNSKTASAVIENFSALGKRRLGVTVSAAYSSEPEQVMAALRRAVERCAPLEGEPVVVEIQDFGESAIAYDVALWIPASDFLGRRWALRRYIWEEFRAAGVEMTYPHLNVHIDENKPNGNPTNRE